LPRWIKETVAPLLETVIREEGLTHLVALQEPDNDILEIGYTPIVQGHGYVRPFVTLEFGARSTGEPNSQMSVTCYANDLVEGVLLPKASPLVMAMSRTFWEKATAAHVYCHGGRSGDRFVRHWHDLQKMRASDHFSTILSDKSVPDLVAKHKGWFFAEKDRDRKLIDYNEAVHGNLQLVPTGEKRAHLETDYRQMQEAGMFESSVMDFNSLMTACEEIQAILNQSNVARE
jgi:hypothetical protein